MINLKTLMLTCILAAVSLSAFNQVLIGGIVKDKKNSDPLPYVNIAFAGKTIGTVTNQNGEFHISRDSLNADDSLGFYYLGYKHKFIRMDGLGENMEVFLEESPIKLDEIQVRAKMMKGRELLKLALLNREINYTRPVQEREIFRRVDDATYIDVFDLVLDKSTFEPVDADFVQQVEDSMIRYSRNFNDHLYRLYNSPGDTIYRGGKVNGIKKIVLNEELGGDLDYISRYIEDMIDNTDEGIFWKFKTGPLSDKITEEEESEEDKAQRIARQERSGKLRDSLNLHYPYQLYEVDRIGLWNWEFIQKPGRYSYKTTGVVPIQGHNCYEVSFKGGLATDYQGKLYINSDDFAILRIEYQLKTRKAENSLKILGVHYNESENSGLVLYEKDENGYYLKYSRHSEKYEYRIMRPFQLIQKKDNPIFNKRISKIDFHLHVSGRSESSKEFLVVNRRKIDEQEYRDIFPSRAIPEEINIYSDTIWKGYSIIEPTRQMKEYQKKIKN